MKKLLVRYTAHQTLHWLFVGIIVPVFTLLMQERGLSLFQVGLSFALYSGAGRALSSGTVDAWFVDEVNRLGESEHLQQHLARAGIFIPVGIGAGSFLGGFLHQYRLVCRFSCRVSILLCISFRRGEY